MSAKGLCWCCRDKNVWYLPTVFRGELVFIVFNSSEFTFQSENFKANKPWSFFYSTLNKVVMGLPAQHCVWFSNQWMRKKEVGWQHLSLDSMFCILHMPAHPSCLWLPFKGMEDLAFNACLHWKILDHLVNRNLINISAKTGPKILYLLFGLI